jgi:signal transduction histidine kinase
VRQDAGFLELAQQFQRLLDCEAACLVLDCPVPELRHPLLDLFPSDLPSSFRYYGSTVLIPLLDEEPVQALLDLAIQAGQVLSSNDCRINIAGIDIRSFAVVPVEQSAGVPGFFLLANPLLGAFEQGEHQLLNNYRHFIAPALELQIRNLYASMLYAWLTGTLFSQSLLQTSMDASSDVSQRNQMELVKNEFVSMISHELRTPLTAIKGYAGLLQAYSVPDRRAEHYEAEMTPVRQQQYLDVIMQQVNHLEVLIGDLLDISRIEVGRLALHFTEVNMALLCRRVTRLAQDCVDQRQPGKYHIHCNVDADLPLAWADPNRVEQVLNNLLDNAIKYSPDGGVIEVLAGTQNPSCMFPLMEEQMEEQNLPEARLQQTIGGAQEPLILYITVRDHGIGIPDQQRTQLLVNALRSEQILPSNVSSCPQM